MSPRNDHPGFGLLIGLPTLPPRGRIWAFLLPFLWAAVLVKPYFADELPVTGWLQGFIIFGLAFHVYREGMWILWRFQKVRHKALLDPRASSLLAVVALAPWPPFALTVGLVLAAVRAIAFSLQQTEGNAIIRAILDDPVRISFLSFALVILVGGYILTFPVMSNSGLPTPPLAALFTATSATCVTGLEVVSLVRNYSLPGQIVVLALIQIGGLGIITLSAFAFTSLSQRLSARTRSLAVEAAAHDRVDSLAEMLRFILVSTAIIEGTGAIILAANWMYRGYSFVHSVWLGVFHSISAFCNAGFALFPDSMNRFYNDPVISFTIPTLIVLGGLGYPVLWSIWRLFRTRDLRHIDAYTRLCLTTTTILLVAGAVLFLVFETFRIMPEDGLLTRLLTSYFQSATLRTAGYTSVDFSILHRTTWLWMTGFMFIGGCSASCAGGLKTSTFAVLGLASKCAVLRHPKIEVWSRQLDEEAVMRSVALLFSFTGLAVGGTILLMAFEDVASERLLFEAVSALCTVGLTTGITSGLSAPSQIVLIALMYLGRVGPLAAFTLVAGKARSATRAEYPRTTLILG